jgi:predicted DNA-binding transcriptional regulator YafY
MMGRGLTKAERLREMERLYFQNSYTDQELAGRLGVARTTIFRYRTELEQQLPFVEEEQGRWKLDRQRYLSSIRVNMSEALTLYLAARRTSQQTRIAQTHVANAIEKLALTLMQPMTTRLVQAAEKILEQRRDPVRATIFETIATAWIESRQVRIAYHAIRQEEERVHRISPYLLEPSPWSDGVYLIGHSDLVNRVLTLKLDRITHAELLGTFTRPTDFNEEKLLRYAWGIWGSDGAPQVVRLKFAPGLAVRRLKESVWHPLECITDLPDGGCLWETPIADWHEMLPWVRGWGASVEVLTPAALRLKLVKESRSLAEMYGWQTRQHAATRVPSHDESFGGFLSSDPDGEYDEGYDGEPTGNHNENDSSNHSTNHTGHYGDHNHFDKGGLG